MKQGRFRRGCKNILHTHIFQKRIDLHFLTITFLNLSYLLSATRLSQFYYPGEWCFMEI